MTRFTHRTSTLHNIAASILLLLATSLVRAQSGSSNETSNADPQFFSNVSGGFGMLYGGFGGSRESGFGHFAGYGSVGYATQRGIDTLTIPASVNYQFGLRYYFDVGSDALFPRVGIGYGWVTNYYHDDIGNSDYNPHVQGLTLHVGAQFYSADGIVFNFDVGMGSRFTVLNAESHPHFYSFYVRPNVGIGYDLTRLFGGRQRSKTIRNKAIDPFGG